MAINVADFSFPAPIVDPFASPISMLDSEGCYFNDQNKEFALTISAVHDSYVFTIYGDGPNAKENRDFFNAIGKRFNFCRKIIRRVGDYCEAILQSPRKIDLLITEAHGMPQKMDIAKEDSGFVTIDTTTPLDCLQHLAPKATMVHFSCSGGAGREFFPNLANHMANNAPIGTTLFAAEWPFHVAEVIQLSPLEVKLVDQNRPEKQMTYKITSDKTAHCPKGKISFLDICSEQPLFRSRSSFQTDQLFLEFQNLATRQWSHFSTELREFFQDRHFSNRELERISLAGVNLDHFQTMAAKYPQETSAEKLTDLVLQEIHRLREPLSIFCLETGVFRNALSKHPIKALKDLTFPFKIEFLNSMTNQWETIPTEDLPKFAQLGFQGSDFETISTLGLDPYLNEEELQFLRKLSPDEKKLLATREPTFIDMVIRYMPTQEAYKNFTFEERCTEADRLLPNGQYWMGHYFSYDRYPHGHSDCAHGSTVFDSSRSDDNETQRKRHFFEGLSCIRGQGTLIRSHQGQIQECHANGYLSAP